jgi:hypothetical protein
MADSMNNCELRYFNVDFHNGMHLCSGYYLPRYLGKQDFAQAGTDTENNLTAPFPAETTSPLIEFAAT